MEAILSFAESGLRREASSALRGPSSSSFEPQKARANTNGTSLPLHG
jgi:hypothetical protein